MPGPNDPVAMKTPKRKRASSVAKAAVPAAVARVADTQIMEAVVAEREADLDATMPVPALVVPEAIAAAIEPAPAPAPAAPEPIVVLPSNSAVKDAAALKVALVKVVALPGTVSLDVRSVERVDTATLQLLYAFVRDRAQRKLAVEWLGCPKALIESSRLLGVHTMLGLPAVGVA